ncbi:GcrA family cell cycle regulator [Bartonella vinsonii]|uniref:GcrA cell cycle regulator n=1 Tax=Bartonella vinsonii subsp. berkhoffii str. Tweed TaxID=1094502 RepID=N6VWE3_BARVB|nr:GcrA family cell cycle regulator [Bartonella vinsonii]AGF75255.1 GcrA cell cycle regulator [Bartonella vinsonii subsp. berkhoffii str. Winnie]ENN95447.1 GcrA cell cycle regulator [Bartonella vinsonii subsp. berkhoffii str. Tweed]
MGWTYERVELLKKLWSEGLSASQIATQLGGVSRNAVIGKVHRLKLPGRGKTAQGVTRAQKTPASSSSPRTRRTPSTVLPTNPASCSIEETALKVEFVAEDVREIDLSAQSNVVVPISRQLNLLQLSENTCRWPVGDPLSSDFHFCGADSGENGPYCAFHAKIAFQPVSERRRIRV